MTLIPLYGFVAGDTLGVLVLATDTDTIREVAIKLQQAVAVRVAPRVRAQIYAGGKLLEPSATVAASGLTALDRIDLVGEEV
jgi:hypothetical protein